MTKCFLILFFKKGDTVTRPIDIINKKISHLNDQLDRLNAIKLDPGTMIDENKPDLRDLEKLEFKRQIEKKQLNLFAGVYSIKSIISNVKTDLPMTLSFVNKKKEEIRFGVVSS